MEFELDCVKNCPIVKICVLGESNVGKSSIAVRFVSDVFQTNMRQTLGACFFSKYFDASHEKKYKLQIWDTAGQERYKSLMPLYYRGASIILIVYDVTNRDSLVQGARSWIRELRKVGPPDAVYALVGNKVDLNEDLREVDEEEAKLVASEIGAAHFEISAKSGQNVTKLFTDVCENLDDDISSRSSKSSESDSLSISSRSKKLGGLLSLSTSSIFSNSSEHVSSRKSLKLRLLGDDSSNKCCHL